MGRGSVYFVIDESNRRLVQSWNGSAFYGGIRAESTVQHYINRSDVRLDRHPWQPQWLYQPATFGPGGASTAPYLFTAFWPKETWADMSLTIQWDGSQWLATRRFRLASDPGISTHQTTALGLLPTETLSQLNAIIIELEAAADEQRRPVFA